jgi:2-methylcitrate dehydratase
MPATLAGRMSEYALGLGFQALPPETVHEAKRRVIDALGCALAGWDAPPCAAARHVASTISAATGATVLGTAHRTAPDWAAFANGCCVRYLDFNDTYLSKEPAHPSDNIPAALAVAETVGGSGRELITAIVLAYEIQCRLCDAASLRARGWDHVTYGAFSTALAAASLMRLTREQTRHAIGIAGVASAALRQSRVGELSHWKGAAFANAARHGVFAAMLAHAGMTGPAPIFEGDKGFEKLVSGPLDLSARWGGEEDDDGQPSTDFMIDRTSIKFWPAEYHAQSAVEAALKLRHQIAELDDIESILIQSHDAAVDIIGSELEKWTPTSRETADHSLPYLVAVALRDGELTARQFDEQHLSNPALLDLVQRVKVERHAELSRLYPKAVGNIVNVQLAGGRVLTQRCDYPPGHAQNPLTDNQVESKFHLLADPVLGRQRADAVAQWVWRMEDASHVGELLPLLAIHRAVVG